MALTATSRQVRSRQTGTTGGSASALGGMPEWAARVWTAAPALSGTGLVLLALLIPTLVALWLDPRAITGAPAWLKPAKFAASAAIYALTLAWIFTTLPAWRRTRILVSRVTATVLLGEIAIIYLQAWRGTTSHFNVSTPLDAALFGIMGAAILAQTLTSVAVAVALWRERFADRALAWALRLGMTLTIVGAMSGAIMTAGPTPQQRAAAQATGRMPVVGAHTVGGPDGGPGLPGTGWSTTHGDLRVPHFIGLHALQVLLLVGLVIRRRPDATRLRVTLAAAAAYTALFAWSLTQALRGIPLIPRG